MSDLENHIKRINEKLQQLLKQYAAVLKENKRLRQELDETKKTFEEKASYISLLEQRIEVLRASKGSMTEEEKKAFEKRIQQYIKEIDKCISFMSE